MRVAEASMTVSCLGIPLVYFYLVDVGQSWGDHMIDTITRITGVTSAKNFAGVYPYKDDRCR